MQAPRAEARARDQDGLHLCHDRPVAPIASYTAFAPHGYVAAKVDPYLYARGLRKIYDVAIIPAAAFCGLCDDGVVVDVKYAPGGGVVEVIAV